MVLHLTWCIYIYMRFLMLFLMILGAATSWGTYPSREISKCQRRKVQERRMKNEARGLVRGKRSRWRQVWFLYPKGAAIRGASSHCFSFSSIFSPSIVFLLSLDDLLLHSFFTIQEIHCLSGRVTSCFFPLRITIFSLSFPKVSSSNEHSTILFRSTFQVALLCPSGGSLENWEYEFTSRFWKTWMECVFLWMLHVPRYR